MFGLLVRMEWTRAVRTKRLLIVLAVFLFSAVADPVALKFLKQILDATGSAESAQMLGEIPEPSPGESLKGFAGDAGRLGAIVFILCFMATAAYEYKRSSESGALLFSRGVSPRALLLAKTVVATAVASLAFAIASLVAVVVTWALYGSLALGAAAVSIPVAAVYWGSIAALCMAGGAGGRSTGWAAALGIGPVLMLSALEFFPALRAWAPASLAGSIGTIADGEGAGGLWKGAVVALVMAAVSLTWGLKRAGRAEV